MQQPDAHAEGEEEGNEAGEQTIDDEPRFVFLHTLHVHLQGGEEHDVVESHLAEQLERCISFQNVQSVFAHEDTRQHHSDDMGDSEFTHDDRGKEDDEEHYEEDQRRVGNWKIFCNIQHRHSTLLLMMKEDPASALFLFVLFLSAKVRINLERAKFLPPYHLYV